MYGSLWLFLLFFVFSDMRCKTIQALNAHYLTLLLISFTTLTAVTHIFSQIKSDYRI